MYKKYLLILFIFLIFTNMNAQTADLIIYNGDVHTMDIKAPFATAIAIKGANILAVGNDADILGMAKESTQLLDAGKKFVMPGFIEGHGHFFSLGEAEKMLRLEEAKTWNDIIDSVRTRVSKVKPGEWIIGRGWHQEKWEKTPDQVFAGFPYHDALSRISPDNPVMLKHASGHLVFVNQKAMDICGIDQNTRVPEGGSILKDGKNRITGVFNENAMDLITQVIERSKSEGEAQGNYWLSCVEEAQNQCLKYGVTSFHDAASTVDEMQQYESLAEKNALKTRLWVMAYDAPQNLRTYFAKEKDQTIFRYFNAGGVKAFIDGALGSYGALFTEPYTDNPVVHGQLVTSESTLQELADICLEFDRQLCTHAIGDRGNRIVLDVYASRLDQKDRRWRIEHAQHLKKEDISRFSSLGITAAMQPIHCTSDALFVEKRLGKERAESGAYLWRTLLDHGTRLNFGTDTPIEPVDPIKNIYAAVTRKPSPEGTAFYPDQKVSREEALYLYTMGNAYSVFEEDIKGSLYPGKLADIVIIDRNLIECTEKELFGAKVTHTIVGGQLLFVSQK